MATQSAKAWIIGLGVVVAILAASLMFVLASDGDDDASQPAVSIESLSAIGYDAVLDFSVHGGDDPSSISIDWGDGSSPLVLRGTGAMSASYTYPPEPGERVVEITVTSPDGTVLRASRPLVLGDEGEAVSDTSTTEDPGGSTATTRRPGSTATSTTATTATTTPERPTIGYELVPANATFDEQGTGEGSARLQGRTVLLNASTSGSGAEAVRTATLTWTIDASVVEGLTGDYQVRTRLEPAWSVNLQASANPGRSARWYVDFEASTGERDLGGSSDIRSVGNGEEQLFEGSDPFGFGTVIPGEELGDVVVTLVLTCQAIPGSTILQFGETSECDARDVGGFDINLARVLFVPAD